MKYSNLGALPRCGHQASHPRKRLWLFESGADLTRIAPIVYRPNCRCLADLRCSDFPNLNPDLATTELPQALSVLAKQLALLKTQQRELSTVVKRTTTDKQTCTDTNTVLPLNCQAKLSEGASIWFNLQRCGTTLETEAHGKVQPPGSYATV